MKKKQIVKLIKTQIIRPIEDNISTLINVWNLACLEESGRPLTLTDIKNIRDACWLSLAEEAKRRTK